MEMEVVDRRYSYTVLLNILVAGLIINYFLKHI